MKNIGQMMKQAQQMQSKMAEMQAKMQEHEATGVSGGGMVKLTLNGKGDLRGLKIDKSVVDPEDVEVLEDLITAAYNDAKGKIEAFTAEQTNAMMGGLKLPPGFKMPF